MTNQIDYLDISGGTAMLLAIIGHSIGNIPELQIKVICSFHIPLFFYTFGYPIQEKGGDSLCE